MNKSALFDGWNNPVQFDRIPMFQTERNGSIEYYVLTAYFVDPANICNQELSRTAADLGTINGTGNTLLFQNGPNPTDLLLGPQRRPDALAQGYSNNKCFPGMGKTTSSSCCLIDKNAAV